MTGERAPDEPRVGAVPAPPECSEDALAEMFVRMNGRKWRFVPVWGNWLHWTGTHWAEDDRRSVRDAVRHVCRAVASDCRDDGAARRLASDRTIRAVTTIAAADRRIATAPQSGMQEPDLLNTPAGIVDLAAARCAPMTPPPRLTQITRAAPGTRLPALARFLDEITGGDRELRPTCSALPATA